MHPDELQSIINGCLRNNRSCQHRLFHAYRDRMARIVGRVLSSDDKAEIEDTIQHAYVELFRTLHLFEGRSSFDTWVYRICTTACMSRLRRKYRPSEQRGSISSEDVGDTSLGPEQELQRRESLRHVRAALDNIRPERRTAFLLADVEGCTIEEVATIMKCAQGTAKSRLFRARNDLEKLLSARGVDIEDGAVRRENALATSGLTLAFLVLTLYPGTSGRPHTGGLTASAIICADREGSA